MNQVPRCDWKYKTVDKHFLSQNTSRDSERFSVVSLSGNNQQTRKPKHAITFAYNGFSFECSKINKNEIIFF